MSCPNLCHDCQTVAHCEKSGCVPKIDGPAPQVLQPLAPSLGERTESVLVDGVAYTIPAAVAGEILRLHMEIQTAQATLAAVERKALTPDRISALWGGMDDPFVPPVTLLAIARRVERAHGIGTGSNKEGAAA